MKNIKSIRKDALVSLIGGALLGLLLALFSPGSLWLGWLGLGLLGSLLIFGTLRLWRALGAQKTLAVVMLVTFLVRMFIGVFLYQVLPLSGFDNPVQQAGYFYADAHERDQAAYQIATQGGLFKQDLAEFRAADQYGGLLALSSLLYQIFSADTHRPLLMVMVSAFAMTLGLAFLFAATSKKWPGKLALIAAWVYALYPDGILLGSSQMREPILIGLACLLFWISLQWQQKPVQTIIWGAVVTLVSCLFSVPAGGATLVVVAGLVFIEWLSTQKDKKARWIGGAAFALLLIVAALAGWKWLKESLAYEYYMTESSSGWITALVEQYGEKLKIPFITFYGLTQPVLPAAIVDPSKPLWRGFAIFRALGWYAALPLIIYGFLVSLKPKKEVQHLIALFLNLIFAAWVLISSCRGGGDQWDNPRYRTIFLPWMALLIGWVILRLRTQKCAWFWRIVAIEVVFLLFFINWYINRHVVIGTQTSFQLMILLILAISAVIVMSGWVWDMVKNRRGKPGTSK